MQQLGCAAHPIKTFEAISLNGLTKDISHARIPQLGAIRALSLSHTGYPSVRLMRCI